MINKSSTATTIFKLEHKLTANTCTESEKDSNKPSENVMENGQFSIEIEDKLLTGVQACKHTDSTPSIY
jgi:hypothetical protein